jgi:hypothetical protein
MAVPILPWTVPDSHDPVSGSLHRNRVFLGNLEGSAKLRSQLRRFFAAPSARGEGLAESDYDQLLLAMDEDDELKTVVPFMSTYVTADNGLVYAAVEGHIRLFMRSLFTDSPCCALTPPAVGTVVEKLTSGGTAAYTDLKLLAV